MANIRSFIQSQLLEPLKQYPTIIQDTMIEIITERLETLYIYTIQFPEIVSPNKNRLDILKAIADQFLFTVREDADINEQVSILEHILYVYKKRGSVDTIENMWKYYGGELPKDVKVVIPSYSLFRYSTFSAFSGTHVFPNDPTQTHQGDYYRPGIYEVKLFNNTYPIDDLRQFMLEELVAAGNKVVFSNALHMEILSKELKSNPYKYDVIEDNTIIINLKALRDTGLSFSSDHSYISGSSDNSKWSGRKYVCDLNIELWKYLYDPSSTHGAVKLTEYTLYENLGFLVATLSSIAEVMYDISPRLSVDTLIEYLLYCTPSTNYVYISSYVYDEEGEVTNDFPGYFVLRKTLLGHDTKERR